MDTCVVRLEEEKGDEYVLSVRRRIRGGGRVDVEINGNIDKERMNTY
jgi:hypothetical protein